MWEIYAYQNADSLFGVFNAAAAIHASGDYSGAVALAAFCGFVVALVAYAFAPEKLQGWQWLASVTLVFAVLVVPKVTVGIVDRTGGAAVRVVDNVPLGAAALGSLTSTVGHTITGLFETAFQTIPGMGNLPAELKYSQSGLMFGNRLVREASDVVFQDPTFRTDLVNFIQNCTVYDLLDRTISPSEFYGSADVWPLMGSPNPARFTTVTPASGEVSVDTCTNVYVNLNGRIPAQVSRIEGSLAFRMNPTLPGPAAAAVIAGQVQQAYLKNQIAGAASVSSDILRQNAMLNALDDAGRLSGQRTNDPAAMVLAVGRAQAIAQKNAAWINNGKVAEQALPVIRNVVEAITYAMFPLLVILMMLTSGKETMAAFKGYASVLVWIQLWPPLYAILNYMATTYAAYDLAAAADLGTGARALSLQTASAIYSRAISGEAVVGYLAITIPFLAWAALKRMENFGSALVGGLTGLQAMVTAGTSAATAGNVSMGNVGMDQLQLSPNRTSAFMSSWQSDMNGNTFTSNSLTGLTAVNLLRNQGFASRTVSVRVSEQDVVQAGRQADAARSEAVSASQERATALTDTFSRGLARMESTRNSDGSTSSSYEDVGQALSNLSQIARSVSDTTNVAQSQVAQIAFGAAATGGVRAATPFAGAYADVSVSAKGGKSYSSQAGTAEQKVLNALTQDQISAFKQFGDRVARDTSLVHSMVGDEKEATELSARLSATTANAERAEAAYSERVSFAERVSTARERGEAISIDLTQDPHNAEMLLRYVEQYGGSSTSAQVMFEAELARQGTAPVPVTSTGTRLPESFSGVQQVHREHSRSPELKPDLGSAHGRNAGKVAASNQSDQSKELLPPASGDLREEVRQEGRAIGAHVSSEQGSFEKRTGVSKDDGGTVRTSKSLLGQSGRQVVTDADSTASNIEEAVKKALPGKNRSERGTSKDR
jgi:conjugal transfer mating pair stabilization protein TraG